MKKTLSIVTVFAVFMAMSGFVMAAEKAAGAAGKGPAAPLDDITLTGKISKMEAPAKGNAPAMAGYVLTDADGNKVKLPKAGPAKEGEAAINLEEFVDAQVEVVGKGKVMEKNGKKSIMLKSITSVKKVEAAADAPAAGGEAKGE